MNHISTGESVSLPKRRGLPRVGWESSTVVLQGYVDEEGAADKETVEKNGGETGRRRRRRSEEDVWEMKETPSLASYP